jgi:hypothetical protein
MTSKEVINGMIVTECNRIKELLLIKNKAYNNSLHETGLLFPMDISTGIKARINDKLNRIKQTGLTDVTEDTLDDLIGYLIHLNISIKLNK